MFYHHRSKIPFYTNFCYIPYKRSTKTSRHREGPCHLALGSKTLKSISMLNYDSFWLLSGRFIFSTLVSLMIKVLHLKLKSQQKTNFKYIVCGYQKLLRKKTIFTTVILISKILLSIELKNQ